MSAESGRGRGQADASTRARNDAAATATAHAADARLERAREATHALRTHLAALLIFRADDADLERRARRLRTAIGEFLEEPRGYLARALRVWPPRSDAQVRHVDAALLRADTLRDEAERVTQIHEARRELRARLARLEERYAARLPALWRQLAEVGELAAHITRVSTARAALDVARSLGQARKALERRSTDLATLVQDALAYVRPADGARLDAAIRGDDVEARLFAVLHVAAERAAEQRAEYARTLAHATERYVEHAVGSAAGRVEH